MGRLRAYVADLQSSLNAHLAGLYSHERLDIDGEWGGHTARAFERVCRVLGLEPRRNVRTFRLVVGATQQRRRPSWPAPRPRRRLRRAAAPSLRPRARRRVQRQRRSAFRRRCRRARHPRARRALRVRLRARGPARPPARCAGLRDRRAGDRLSQRLRPRRVRNPVKSPPGGLLAVTRENYAQYLNTAARGSAIRAWDRCS